MASRPLALGLIALVALVAMLVLVALPRAAANPVGGVAAISAESVHTCLLTPGGGMQCWGENVVGEVGTGAFSLRERFPTDVTGLGSGVAEIAAGSCALLEDTSVKCWGGNTYGQVGDGTTTHRNTPVDVCVEYDAAQQQCLQPLTGVAALGGTSLHTCALMLNSTVKCWGRNEWGQLGDGTVGDGDPFTQDNNRTTAVDVCAVYDETAQQCNELLTGVAMVSVGANYTCAVLTAGTAKCWGSNTAGQLGHGAGGILDPEAQGTPVDVCRVFDVAADECSATQTGLQAIDAALLHTCALTTTGGVKCWGAVDFGALGDNLGCDTDGDFVCHEPVDVVGLQTGVNAVTVGSSHTCALTVAGGVKCWGHNFNPARIGDGGACGFECPVPVDVPALTNDVVQVEAGSIHTCALTEDGAIWCWGGNFYGQLGGAQCCMDTDVSVQVVAGVKPTPTATASPTITATPSTSATRPVTATASATATAKGRGTVAPTTVSPTATVAPGTATPTQAAGAIGLPEAGAGTAAPDEADAVAALVGAAGLALGAGALWRRWSREARKEARR
ncbi:MAG: hypothetical protein WEE64_08915 [Dehalococcoidia bacterium]